MKIEPSTAAASTNGMNQIDGFTMDRLRNPTRAAWRAKHHL
jgi:hypothetical protein